ncbi:MAG: hypothetical protein MI757_18415, partial [Pirellulales bacterium]|nr:hypothetical protein [Pirellulales bacterium]
MTTTAIFIALFAVSAVNVSVETLEGKRVSGSITGLDTDSITLETNGKRSVTPIAKVARIIHEDASDEKLARPRVWIELADGTRLTATNYSVKGDEASLLLTSGQPLDLPRRQIRHVRLKHQDDDLAKQWKKILGTDANADLLVIRKRGTIDFLEGVVGDIDG